MLMHSSQLVRRRERQASEKGGVLVMVLGRKKYVMVSTVIRLIHLHRAMQKQRVCEGFNRAPDNARFCMYVSFTGTTMPGAAICNKKKND